MNELSEGQAAERRSGCGIIAMALTAASVPVAIGLNIALETGALYVFVLLSILIVVAVSGGWAWFVFFEKHGLQMVASAGFLAGTIVPVGLALFDRQGLWASALIEIGLLVAAGVIGAAISWFFAAWLSTGSASAKLSVGFVIVIGTAAIWLFPEAAKDRSCHNTLRDGRRSISPIASLELEVPMREWPELAQELEEFAESNHWQMRSHVRADDGFPWFQVSLCRESGTNIFVTTAAFEAGWMSISIFQPQGGDSWRQPLQRLHDHLDRRWPVRAGAESEVAPTPSSSPSKPPLHPTEKSL